MFSFFRGGDKDEEEKKQAKAIFDKVTSYKGDSREVRSMRIRMGLLCRAHLDKTFVDGAEKTALYQEIAALAAASKKEVPPPPEATEYLKVATATNEVWAYLPLEYAEEAFALGSRYQKAEITPYQAIIAMQGLADQICRYELRLDEPFETLQFLREEMAEKAAGAEGEAPASNGTPPGG